MRRSCDTLVHAQRGLTYRRFGGDAGVMTHTTNYDTVHRLLEVEIWDPSGALALSATIPSDLVGLYANLKHTRDGYTVKVFDVTTPYRNLIIERRSDGVWVGSVG